MNEAPAPVDESLPTPPEQLVQIRRRQRTTSRARTISIRRLSKTELERGRAEFPPDEDERSMRPVTRGDCETAPRPCPFVSCRHHLYLDVHPVRGSIKINFPEHEPGDLVETCALDVADAGGGITLEHTAVLMNLTRERVRQLETIALSKIPASTALALAALAENKPERG